MKILQSASNVDGLLRQIRKAADGAGGAGVLFRGEAKNNQFICSGLARIFPAQYLKSGAPSLVEDMQKTELDVLRRYTDSKKDEEAALETALVEVQHYGGKTSLIDFTEDYNIALFFACDGFAKEDGRVVLFNTAKKPEDIEIIRPAKELTNRIVSQKSVFLRLRGRNHVYEKDGEDFVTIIPVPAGLKPEVMRRLKLHHNITTESIYYDIHGYIRNRANHHESVSRFYEGYAFAGSRQYKEAVKSYTKAIELKPDFAAAYNNRGVAYRNKRNYSRAIADYDNAIELKPDYATAYNNRGNAYRNKRNYSRAIADYDKAIELKPDYAAAYRNRGLVKKKLQDYEGARADFQTALQLAEKQGNRDFFILVQMNIDDLPPGAE